MTTRIKEIYIEPSKPNVPTIIGTTVSAIRKTTVKGLVNPEEGTMAVHPYDLGYADGKWHYPTYVYGSNTSRDAVVYELVPMRMDGVYSDSIMEE